MVNTRDDDSVPRRRGYSLGQRPLIRVDRGKGDPYDLELPTLSSEDGPPRLLALVAGGAVDREGGRRG